MNSLIKTLGLCLLACLLCCCKGKTNNEGGLSSTVNGQQSLSGAASAKDAGIDLAESRQNRTQSMVNGQLEYAQGFKVQNLSDGIRLIDIQDPQAEESTAWHFALVPKELKSFDVPQDYTVVRTPIDKAICMTMLQLADFIVLKALDHVSGITSTKNLFNENVLQRVKEHKIFTIGSEGDFDAEVIMAANPEVIFISPFKRGGYEAIKQTGITLVPHLGYKELHPLGQAEWVKFIGLFIGQEEQANVLFDGICKRYDHIKEMASKAAHRPTVLSGEMHGGNWYAVGGKSFLAQIFADAGADYILKDDPNSGGVNIEFEKLYAMAANADYWRILNSYPGEFSYEALKSSEPRNELFKSFKEHQVIYCNMQRSPYYEKAPVEPDVLLSDLVYVFHPEVLPADYQPVYYKLLP